MCTYTQNKMYIGTKQLCHVLWSGFAGHRLEMKDGEKQLMDFLLLQPSALLEKHPCDSLNAETQKPFSVKR